MAMIEKNYNPLNDTFYMSTQMKQFFKCKLYEEMERLDEEITYVSSINEEKSQSQPDLLDQGTTESLQQISYAFHAHEKLLSRQIELALRRLASGSYGYCVITGEPIGVSRLMAAPYTPHCIEVQEAKEKQIR